MKKTLLACVLGIISIATAQAQTAPTAKPLRFMVGTGVSGGGDKLATTSYTNGNSSDIKAGSGLHLYAGVDYRVNQQFSLQANIGTHIHFTPAAKNGDASFVRYPLEAIGYFHANEKWRIGAGVRFVKSAELKGSGFAAGIDQELGDATGALVEVEYMVSPTFGIKLRGVKENYEHIYRVYSPALRRNVEFKDDISGNHIGIAANFYF